MSHLATSPPPCHTIRTQEYKGAEMAKLKRLTVTQVAALEGVTRRRVLALIENNQIAGCEKLGSQWTIPENYVVQRGESGPTFQKINKPKDIA